MERRSYWGSLRDDQVGLQGDQLFRKSPYLIDITTTPANLHPQDTTVSPTQFCEPLPEPRELGLSLGIVLVHAHEHTDATRRD